MTHPALADETQLKAAMRDNDLKKVEAMLVKEPSLASSAVLMSLFARAVKDGFLEPKKNPMVKMVLAQKPKLDVYGLAAVGSPAELKAELVRDPALANTYHPMGWTALHFAAFSGNVEAIKVLLAAGADVHVRAKTKFQNQPLIVSLLTGQLEAATVLIENGASPLERQAFGFSPLHEAAFIGRSDLVELLLKHGAELEARTNDGRTPLTEAIRAKHTETASLLRAKGAKEVEMNEVLSNPPKE